MNDNNLEALYSQADLYLEQNNINNALSTYNKLCELDPDSAEPWFMLGLIHNEIGQSEQAIAFIYKAIEIDPTHPDAHLNIAHHLLTLNDNKGALNHCELALKHDVDYAEAWFFKSSLLAASGQYPDAVEAARNALAIDPTLSQGWAKLALMESNCNHLEPAIQACQNAIAQNAHDVGSHKLFGTLLLKKQKPSEAVSAFDAVLNLAPKDIEAIRGKGFALLLEDKPLDAAECFSRALDINSECTASLLALCRIKNTQANYDESAAFATRLLKLDTDSFDAHIQLANSLYGMGQHELALTHYNTVLEKDSLQTEALTGRADLYEKTGQYQKAFLDLQPLLEFSPSAESIFAFSKIAPHVKQIPKAIELLEALIASLENNQGQLAYYHLAQLYLQVNDHEQAFINHARSNKLRKCDYNADDIERLVDWIIDEYSLTSLSSAPVSTQDTNMPIFIVGMLRSGTTLTEQIIASHADVFGGGELQEMPQIAQHLANNTKLKLLAPPAITSLTTSTLDKVAGTYLERIEQLSNGAKKLTDKMLYNAFHLGLIQLMFPNAKVIHCVRDPMDTCISNYFQNYGGYDGFATSLEHTGHFYRQFERMMSHWEKTLKLPMLKVNYETLVSNQKEVTKQILVYCDLPWDDACLKFYENSRVANTASYNQIRKPMYDKAVTRWRYYEDHLDPLKQALDIN